MGEEEFLTSYENDAIAQWWAKGATGIHDRMFLEIEPTAFGHVVLRYGNLYQQVLSGQAKGLTQDQVTQIRSMFNDEVKRLSYERSH